MRRSTFPLLSAAIALLSTSQAMAITHTWSGGNSFGPDSMANALNWSGGVPVSSSAALTLVFPGFPNSTTPNQNIASPLVLQSLSVTGNNYVFSGNPIQFSNLGSNPTLITSSSNSTFNTPMAFSAPTTVTNNGFSTWNGTLSGAAPLTISGTAQLNIGGAGPTAYNGLMTVNSGTVVFNRGGTVTNGPVQLNSGAGLFCNVSNQFGPNSDLGVSGGMLILNTGNQTLRNLTLGGLGSISFSSSNTLTVTGNISTTVGASAIGNNSTDTLDLNGGPTLINVSNSGPSNLLNINASLVNGTFQKAGPGILSIFSGTNSFTGTNIVSAGVLRTQPSSIGTSVLNNATVSFAGGGTLNSNVISGSGNVILESTYIQLNAAQSYTGGTDLQSGAVIDANASTLSGNYTSTSGINGGTIQFMQTANGTNTASFSGGVQIRKYGVGILSIGGTNTQNGTVDLYEGGLNVTSDTALGVGILNAGFGLPISLEATGTRTIANSLFLGSGTLSIVGSGDFDFTSTNAKVLNSALVHSSTGSTKVAGKFSTLASSSITVNAGTLSLGDAGIVGGFIAAGPISINGGTLTLKSLNFISLPDVTLAGGTLNTPNGYAIPLGAALQGNGGVSGRVASANGSTIIANGNLVMGDSLHPAGANLDGELYTNANTVTLLDSNQAVLGSYTRIGTTSSNGTLIANNGLVVNFGRNLEGRGQVQSINALANAVIVNGDASGDSFANYLEFTGYVKGVGTFNNVAFSGTFSPGLSPALLTVGSVVLTPSNVLDMEIGGLLRGSQYDAFDVNGTMLLNGQLKLTFINAFSPSAGNQFDLINGTTTGTFSSFNFPSLNVGLYWDTSLLYSQGIVQILQVPEPTCLATIAMAGVLTRRRRR